MKPYRSPPALITTATITVEVDGVETEVDVTCEFDYTSPERGSWSGGQQMEPDYPASADLLSAKDADGRDWYAQLGPKEIERLEIEALEKADDPGQDEPDYDPDDDLCPDDYIGPD